MARMDRRTDIYLDERRMFFLIKDEFCENIKKYEKSMYNLAYSIIKNETDAVDVVAETVYRAYIAYPTLKNKKAFKAWILHIVHNTAVEMIRKNKNLLYIDEIEEVADDKKMDITTRITVRDAVNSLNQPYRTVAILYYYEDIPVVEIAKITNSSIMAIRQQLRRSRKMLRDILGGNDE